MTLANANRKQNAAIKRDAAWAESIKKCADPPRAKHFFELLAATAETDLRTISSEQARVLAGLFSGSHALSNLLVAHPDWLELLEPESLKHPRRKQGLEKETAQWLAPLLKAGDYVKALSYARQFKQREMLRIAARDLARLGEVSEIMREISDVADLCLESVWQICRSQLADRYGQPYHQDAQGRWHRTFGCVLGLGKLGGQELNYSSDVDVIFA